MDIFDGLSALGGLCLFLFGMSIMAEALQRRAGGRLGGQLRRMTRSRWAGFFTGLAVTAAVQETGNAELIAAVLNYGNSAVSGQDKEKVRKKKDQRETSVTNFIFDAEKLETLKGKTFMVTGSLKTFVSRDELKECLTTCGAVLTETLGEDVDYLITNTPDSGTAKNKKAVELGVARITEAQFNDMTGRKAAG